MSDEQVPAVGRLHPEPHQELRTLLNEWRARELQHDHNECVLDNCYWMAIQVCADDLENALRAAGEIAPPDKWVELGTLLKTAGMSDPDFLIGQVRGLLGEIAPPAPTEDYTAKYFELLHAVGMKHAGETRHETALRYLRRAEESHGPADARSLPPAPPQAPRAGAMSDTTVRLILIVELALILGTLLRIADKLK